MHGVGEEDEGKGGHEEEAGGNDEDDVDDTSPNLIYLESADGMFRSTTCCYAVGKLKMQEEREQITKSAMCTANELNKQTTYLFRSYNSNLQNSF